MMTMMLVECWRMIAAVMIVVAVMVEGCSGDDGKDLVK